MIRNERFIDGVSVYAEVVDLDAGTFTVERDGQVESVRPLTADEVDLFTPKVDARESALAKLQALGLTEAEALAIVGG
jgi:hypothetical protein